MTKPAIAALLVCTVVGCHRCEEPEKGGRTNEPPVCAVEAEPAQEPKPGEKEDSAMKMTVRKATEEEIEKLGIKSWPIWTCDPKTFDWHYDSREICYTLRF